MTERTLTVAAIQTSYGPDMAANIAKTEAFIREAARQRRASDFALRAVSGHLFLHAAGPEDGLKRPIPPPAHPCVLALDGAGGRAARRDSGFIFRGRRARLLF